MRGKASYSSLKADALWGNAPQYRFALSVPWFTHLKVTLYENYLEEINFTNIAC